MNSSHLSGSSRASSCQQMLASVTIGLPSQHTLMIIRVAAAAAQNMPPASTLILAEMLLLRRLTGSIPAVLIELYATCPTLAAKTYNRLDEAVMICCGALEVVIRRRLRRWQHSRGNEQHVDLMWNSRPAEICHQHSKRSAP